MAIHLERIYGKKLGLPMYSSHNFSEEYYPRSDRDWPSLGSGSSVSEHAASPVTAKARPRNPEPDSDRHRDPEGGSRFFMSGTVMHDGERISDFLISSGF